MKFLIIDDDKDLLEVLSMIIAANYNIEIETAGDGQAAIEKIQAGKAYDLILCDYNMPKKNGADVFNELRKENQVTPFILISTDIEKFKRQFPHATQCTYIEKPFSEFVLTAKIEEILSKVSMPSQNENYLPVSIDMLEKIVYPGVPLFIRLSSSQFIKVLPLDANFDKFESERFRNKKLTHLYAERTGVSELISNFRKNVFANIDWNSIDAAEALESLQPDWELILDSSRNFGWSESVKTLANENIAKSIMLIKKVPKLRECLEMLKISNGGGMVAPHSYILAIFVTAILGELGWATPGTLQKITFAALLHDMDLTDEVFIIKMNRISGKTPESELNQQANLKIYNHPVVASEFVKEWTSCPPDVDKLILQHHENFEGSGFPNKLAFSALFPLTRIMIFCEEIVYQCLNNKNQDPLEYLKSREKYYNRDEFKKVYVAALKLFEHSTNA